MSEISIIIENVEISEHTKIAKTIFVEIG